MSTLKALSIKLIAISALGLAMTAPVIAATQSTANTLPNAVTSTSTAATKLEGAQVPATQTKATTDADQTTTTKQTADTVASEAATPTKDDAETKATDTTK